MAGTAREVFVIEYSEPKALGGKDTQVYYTAQRANEEYVSLVSWGLKPTMKKVPYNRETHGVPNDAPVKKRATR